MMTPILIFILSTLSLSQSVALDSLFTKVFPAAEEPGGAVLIVRNGKVSYERCFGLADIRTGAEITPDTFFNIASCSKQFTAVAVLQLVEHGKLSLDDKVAEYFPEYTDPVWDKILIRHLLSHSSGIPDRRGYLTREQKIYGDEALALEYLSTLDSLNFEPGTQYQYMNPTYTLLGELVSRVSGKPFTTYMDEMVFNPAGMNRTLYFDRDHQERIPNMSHGYRRGETGWQEYDFGEETFFATRPDGGIYTSVREFSKWETALRKGKVLGTKYLDEAWTPQTDVSGSKFSDYQNRPGTAYGYGWFIESSRTGRVHVIYHTGDNGGFKILAARYPDSRTLVLVFANRSDWDRYGAKTEIERILKLK